MNHQTSRIVIATTLLAAMPLLAQQQEAAPSSRTLPGVAIGAAATAVATVEAIDLAAREVTLRHEDGEVVTFIAGEEVRNLAQVERGDRVTVEYDVGLVMALSPPGSGIAARADEIEVARAELGARPGGVVRKTTAATGTVTEIDSEARTVTLRGALQTVTLPVAEDIDLSQVKVGDQVDAVYQETLAVRVEPVRE
jgi:Cu/Ag efflux protein CusF